VGKKLKGTIQLAEVDGELVPHDTVEVTDSIRTLFSELDTDGSGNIDIEEFALALKRLNMEPKSMEKLMKASEKRGRQETLKE
jgi:Ca2+-binding EF-hand superfamily protein